MLIPNNKWVYGGLWSIIIHDYSAKIVYTCHIAQDINKVNKLKKLAIANKESIICGWNLISKEIDKYKTEFIPVDSEHFSIFKLTNNIAKEQIKKIIITASGGPFLNKKTTKKKIRIIDALKHPNWKMGKKISIDSSTLMNKVFEVIEAKKIFNINYNQIKIVINPNSYIHSIVIFKNGTIKILAHEPDMIIPIYNSLYADQNKNFFNTKDLDLNKINNLNLSNPNLKKFKVLKILKIIPSKDTLYETILISINDELVDMFLNKKIEHKDISFYLLKIINFKFFKKYCNVKPVSVDQIYRVRNLAKQFVKDYMKYD